MSNSISSFSNLSKGRYCFSKFVSKGIGVLRLPARFTGASKNSKQFSIIIDEISDAIPPKRLSYCKIIAFPVFFTELIIHFLSNGFSVLKSIKSESIECFSTTLIAS